MRDSMERAVMAMRIEPGEPNIPEALRSESFKQGECAFKNGANFVDLFWRYSTEFERVAFERGWVYARTRQDLGLDP